MIGIKEIVFLFALLTAVAVTVRGMLQPVSQRHLSPELLLEIAQLRRQLTHTFGLLIGLGLPTAWLWASGLTSMSDIAILFSSIFSLGYLAIQIAVVLQVLRLSKALDGHSVFWGSMAGLGTVLPYFTLLAVVYQAYQSDRVLEGAGINAGLAGPTLATIEGLDCRTMAPAA